MGFKGVYNKFNGCLKKVSKVYQGCFKEVLKVFQQRLFPDTFNVDSRELQGYLKVSFKAVSKTF